MQKIILFIVCCFFAAIAYAEVANPEPAVVIQPDGTLLTIQLHGDEFSSYTTTLDGYTVAKCDDNAYRYIVVEEGEIIVTDIMAHDADKRNTKERNFCSSHPKHLNIESQLAVSERRRARDMHKLSGVPDRSNFRGLVILVNYNDCSINKSNPQQLFDDMINKEGYTGYMDEDKGWQEYTGSMRDYFSDSSMGTFVPEFDVIGPVDIDYSMYDQKRTSNSRTIIKEALKKADDLVDYRIYDGNNDGEVDMFYVIFAGYASSSTGNDGRLLWPHASFMATPSFILDGMKFGRYACSTAMYGWDMATRHDNVLCGIGTMCHEFSHTLGLRDHYDTDGNGSITPAKWDVMASGTHNNQGRTPPAYNMLERITLGMAQPTLIDEKGDYELPELTKSNFGYKIMAGSENEYFLLENRQQIKWDASQAGHGLLVWRVDSTNVAQWNSNDVNVDPDHQLFELLRATPKWNSAGTSVTDSDGDPFPGRGRVTEITNETTPSLRSWVGAECPFIIWNIRENGETVTFNIEADGMEQRVENFETMKPFVKAENVSVNGKTGTWTFTNACVLNVNGYTKVNGNVAALYKDGAIVSSAQERGIKSLHLSLANSNTMPAILRVYASTDGGDTWTKLGNDIVLTSKAETNVTLDDINLPPSSRIKILFYSGSSIYPVYVDNIRFFDSDETVDIQQIDARKSSSKEFPVYNFGNYVIHCLNGKKYLRKQ